MKLIIKYTYKVLLLSLIISFSACDNFIEEDNYTNVTTDEYLDERKADELIVGIYQSLRAVYKDYKTAFSGTDIFTQQGQLFSVNKLNEYDGLSSDEGAVLDLWKRNYITIARANTAINRYENQIIWTSTFLEEKAYGIAQAKALRAQAYYNLVQQFSDVPLILDEITDIKEDFTRDPEETVFAQIIKDLEEAIPVLKDKPDFGRFSSRAARHVLADVYVSRGYKTYGNNPGDFTKAAELAEQVIGDYDIRKQTFEKLFEYSNQKNDEVLFSIQYGSEGINYDDRNNNKHAIFMNSVNNYKGIARANPYGRQDLGLMPTEYFYSLFEENDSREAVTLHRVLYANEKDTIKSDNGIDPIAVGDTIIFYPKKALSAVELANKLNRYWVYNPDQYYYGTPDNVAGAVYQYSSNVNKTNFPIFKKFDDVGFDESQGGSRDTYVYRVAETHLIAAEAYLQTNNETKALEHINIVRERATGEPAHYTGSLTIDQILDERAIELAGEENRWNILKRTGTLETRINKYNPHVIDHGEFKTNVHYLRPIPAQERELSDGSLGQNEGY